MKKKKGVVAAILALALFGGGIATGAVVTSDIINQRVEEVRQESFDKGLLEGGSLSSLFDVIGEGGYALLKISEERFLLYRNEDSGPVLYSYDKDKGLKVVARSGIDEDEIGYNFTFDINKTESQYCKVLSNGDVLLYNVGSANKNNSLCLYKYSMGGLLSLSVENVKPDFVYELGNNIILVSSNNSEMDSCFVNIETWECKTLKGINCLKSFAQQPNNKFLSYGRAEEGKNHFYIYKPGKIELLQVESDLFDKFGYISDTCLKISNNDLLFGVQNTSAGTTGFGIGLYNDKTEQFSLLVDSGQSSVVAFYETKNGKVLITAYQNMGKGDIYTFDIDSRILSKINDFTVYADYDIFVEDEAGVTLSTHRAPSINPNLRYDFASGKLTEIK